MPIEYDIKQDAFYQEGVEDERKRMEEEKEGEKKNLIIRLIESKKLSHEEIADLTKSDLSYVLKLSKTL